MGFLLRTKEEDMEVGILISFSTLKQTYLLLIVLFFRFLVNLQFFQRGLQQEKNNLDFFGIIAANKTIYCSRG